LKYIYLIRHGQTDYNVQGIVQGSRVDTNINEEGRRQATKFFETYKEIKFDKIYISKLKRTYQSVEKFIELGIPYESHLGLNEISWGDQDGQASSLEMRGYYQNVANAWANGNLDLKIGGGESPREVAARQQPVLDLILSREQEKNILICMHGRAIRILLCLLTNSDLSKMDTFEHSNLCLYLLKYENSIITIEKHFETGHLV
jgi:broad specificity phosphatase PhoE